MKKGHFIRLLPITFLLLACNGDINRLSPTPQGSLVSGQERSPVPSDTAVARWIPTPRLTPTKLGLLPTPITVPIEEIGVPHPSTPSSNGWIAFQTWQEMLDGSVSTELLMIDGDGEALTCITCQLQNLWVDGWRFPSWSPNGQLLAFGAIPDIARNLHYDLYALDLQQGRLISLTATEVDEISPSWSPDNRRLAFMRGDEGTEYFDIFVLDIQDMKEVQITFDGGSSPTWLDNERILYFHSDGLYVVSVREKNPNPVLTDERYLALVESIRISPDRTKIALDPNMGDYQRAIFIMPTDTWEITQLVGKEFNASGPAWSPDSSRIAFTGNEGIFAVGVDGSNLTQVVQSDERVYKLTWSPDGQSIAFVSFIGEDREIFVGRVDGGGVRQITNFPDLYAEMPVWSPK